MYAGLAVLVDLDGTLAVSPISNVIREGYRHIALYSGRSVSEVEHYSWSIHAELVRRADPKAFDWDYIYERVSEFFSVRIGFSIEKRLLELCDSSRLLDNAHEVLADLRRMADLLILATNGLTKYQRCVIETLELSRYFDLVYTPDTRGCLKNCERFYAIPGGYDSGVVVGDNYTFDVYYPKRFGLKAVHVVRAEVDPYIRLLGIRRTYEPDATITNLGQLLDAIRGIVDK